MLANMRPINLMKPIVKVLGFIALLMAVIVAIGEAMAWSFLRQPIEKGLSSSLKREVNIGDSFQMHVLGAVTIKTNSLWISAPPNFKVDYFIDAKSPEVSVSYGDIWAIKSGKPYNIKRLKVDAININLIRDAQGLSTWAFNQQPKNAPTPMPTIDAFVINNGQVLIQDQLLGADLKVALSTKQDQQLKQSTTSLAATGKFRNRALSGQLDTQGLLALANAVDATTPINSKGWVDYGGVHLTFNGQASDLLGAQKIVGHLSIKGPSLGVLGDLLNVTLPTTAPFMIQADIDKDKRTWLAEVSNAEIGSSVLSGHFKFEANTLKPVLTGELKGKRFVLADIAPAFGAKVAQNGGAAVAKKRVFPDQALNFDSFNRMNAAIKVSLAYVDLGNLFARPISPLIADLSLQDNALTLTHIKAKTADGEISGNLAIDNHGNDGTQMNKMADKPAKTNKPAQWHVNLKVSNINLEKWLEVSKQRQLEAKKAGRDVPPAYVTGLLNGTLQLDGQGNSTAEFMHSLNGKMSFYIKSGRLSHLIVEVLGLDIAQSLGVLIKGDQTLPLACAVVNLEAKQGQLNSRLSLFDTPVTTIVLSGGADLSKEQLNLHLVAAPKNFSPFTVRSPINVQGSFLQPTIVLEKTPIIGRIAGAIGLSIVNPLAAILPFLDTGSGQNTEQDADCKASLAALKAKLK